MVLLQCCFDFWVNVCKFIRTVVATGGWLLLEWLRCPSESWSSLREWAGKSWCLLDTREWWHLFAPIVREVCSVDGALVADVTHYIVEEGPRPSDASILAAAGLEVIWVHSGGKK